MQGNAAGGVPNPSDVGFRLNGTFPTHAVVGGTCSIDGIDINISSSSFCLPSSLRHSLSLFLLFLNLFQQ